MTSGSTFRVLFVCIGNICRSPLGAALLTSRLPGTRFEIDSAGVMAMVGQGMDPGSAAHAQAQGIDVSSFRAQQLTADHVTQADLILTATKELRSRVLSESPAALRRTFTALEFAALLDIVEPQPDPRALVAAAAAARSQVRLTSYDIPDPYRRGSEAHAAAAELMEAAVDRIATSLRG